MGVCNCSMFCCTSLYVDKALAVVRSKAVVVLLLNFCLSLRPLWESVIVLCFVVRHFM